MQLKALVKIQTVFQCFEEKIFQISLHHQALHCALTQEARKHKKHSHLIYCIINV